MPSTREVQARHAARVRRQTQGATGVFAPPARHFTPERTGPPCPVCKEPTSRYLVHAGIRVHPCCAGL